MFLLDSLRKTLPDTTPLDRYLLPYVSFWTRIVLRRKKPLIIGVTGTAGKTTVTQMLGHVLMQPAAKPYVGVAAKTSGNLNGDYGVRLSILRKSSYPTTWLSRIRHFLPLPIHAVRQAFSSDYPKVLVLEYGTYEAGHIHDLVEFAPAKIAIVTNIGPAHLERHKTIEGVYLEKRALVLGVPSDGLVVLGAGHDFVSRLHSDSAAPVRIVDGRGIALAEKITKVVCKHLGVPEEIIDEGLRSFKPPKSRLNRFQTRGITVIDDSYNANPVSMKLGLDLLAEEKAGDRRCVALLGVMRELGEQSAYYHREMGAYAKKRADVVIAVGEGAEEYGADQWFRTSSECADHLTSLVKSGDIVFIKGSHFANMGVVVERMRQT